MTACFLSFVGRTFCSRGKGCILFEGRLHLGHSFNCPTSREVHPSVPSQCTELRLPIMTGKAFSQRYTIYFTRVESLFCRPPQRTEPTRIQLLTSTQHVRATQASSPSSGITVVPHRQGTHRVNADVAHEEKDQQRDGDRKVSSIRAGKKGNQEVHGELANGSHPLIHPDAYSRG